MGKKVRTGRTPHQRPDTPGATLRRPLRRERDAEHDTASCAPTPSLRHTYNVGRGRARLLLDKIWRASCSARLAR